MQQQKSAIEKLLDQEHARQEPDTFHGIANVGLWGISTIDEGVLGLKQRFLRTVASFSVRGGTLLKKTGDLANEGLEAVAAAERYSNEKLRRTKRFWTKD